MKGTYCLIISLEKDIKIKIGSLYHRKEFNKGTYVYIGSAMNNLEKRVSRHLSDDKKKRWHIDYLLLNKNTKIQDIIINNSEEKLECKIAQELLKNNEYIENFGSSDCKCISHLIYFKNKKEAINNIKNAFNSINKEYEFYNKK